jgi:hypothetical protein
LGVLNGDGVFWVTLAKETLAIYCEFDLKPASPYRPVFGSSRTFKKTRDHDPNPRTEIIGPSISKATKKPIKDFPALSCRRNLILK